MAKGGNIEYGIKFNVDTNGLKEIKNELATLEQSLKKIQTESLQQTPGTIISKEFNEAAETAKKVSNIISSSWNAKLNQLDLSKFSSQITKSFGSLKNLQTSLAKAGDVGVNSFNQIQRSILHTNIELTQSSTLLNKMAVTMANTVRFGISSSVFNTITNSISKAYDYVKKLDSSLNDIRIVSGQSADEMEKFAVQANKAAQSLGATTLDYTKASLIYYQQGLSTEEASARADVTVKMANVLKSSTSDVSNYMTAIWNNFAKGSQDLEYFADVITALGASTASSSEEIATGLSKFSSVAKTVGLSYEYATAALATVVAQTRQSADIVGTAFKTIFARMEDLKLGKTLEDGTTLGKYSSTLAKIGVNIKDQNGQLKTMDTILSEMGSKWQTLNKDQQVAVAQGVAGVRQYTQLVALMDNWDTFSENLQTASSATGTLAKQQDIYLDSVEAHLNKLSAASEKLYSDIFDEDSIKTFADALTKLLGIADNLVQGLGGGLNSFVYFGSILSNVFNVQIAGAINRQIVNMERLGASAANVEQKMEAIALVRASEGKDTNSEALELEAELAERILKLRGYISQAEEQELTARQQRIGDLKTEIEYLKEHKKIAEAIGIVDSKKSFEDQKEKEEEKLERLRNRGQNVSDSMNTIQRGEGSFLDYQNVRKTVEEEIKAQTELTDVRQAVLDKVLSTGNEEEIKKLSDELLNSQKLLSDLKAVKEKLSDEKINEHMELEIDSDAYDEVINEAQKRLHDNTLTEEERLEIVEEIAFWESEQKKVLEEINKLENGMLITDKEEERILEMQAYQENVQVGQVQRVKQGLEGVNAEHDKTLEKKQQQLDAEMAIEKEQLRQKERAVEISNVVSGMSTLVSAGSSLVGIGKTWFGDNDLSFWDKFTQTLTVSAATLPILINGWSKLKQMLPSSVALLKEWVATQMVKNATEKTGLTLEAASAALKDKNALATLRYAAAELKANIQRAIKNLLEKSWGWAAVVAGITAVTVALGVWIAKLIIGKSEEEKLKEAVAETGEEVKKTTEAYQDLKDKISDYTDAKKGLEGLKEGTVEFYEAVITANEKAQTLIDTLGLLAGQDYSIDVSSGLISINEDSLKNALQSKQQATFRAQATNTLAKLDLTKYYQRQNIEEFANAVFSKTNVMLADAEKILNGTANQTEKMSVWGFQKESDITEEVGKFRAEYNKRSAEMLAQQQQLAAQLIQGYASQNQLETYQALTKTGQSLINSYIGKQADFANIDTDFEKYEDQAIENIIKFIESNPNENLFVSPLLMNPFNEEGIKAYYAKEKLGWNYNQKSEEWTNENGNKVNIEDVSYREAIQGWSIGQQTEESIKNTLKHVQKIKNTEAIGKLGSDSKDYVTEAAIAISTGQSDQYNFSSMRPEEIDALKAAYDELGGSFSSFMHLSDEYFEKLKAQSSEEVRAAEDLKRYNEEIADQATQLGISKNALKVYDTALQNASKSTIEYTKSAASAAAQAYEFNKNYNAGRKVFEDNKDAWNAYTKALKKGEDISYDVADAVGEIIDDLEKMGITLNNSQLKDPKVLNNIKKLFTGTKKEAEAAYQELEKLSLDNMWDQWRAQVLKTSTLTNEAIEDLKKSITSLNEDDLIKGDNFTRFREYISNAHMTYDELIKFLDANHIKYEVDDIEPVEVKKNTIPGSKTTQRHTLTGTNPYTGEQIDGSLSWEETVENLTSDFYTLGKEAKITKGAAAKTNFSPSSSSSKKSGSGSSSKPDKMERVETDIDRYHKVNTQITKVDNSLKKVQSQQEKLVGSKLIENLTKQWSLLNIQIDNYTEKLKIANGEQAELAEKLAAQGVKFNSDGTISNYSEAIKAQENYVNSLIDKYNKMSKAQQENYKTTVETAKKNFDKFKTNIDRYDELVSDFIPQLQQSIQDAIDKQIELNVQKFNLEITVTLDLNQATRDWNAWKKRIIDGINENDILGNARARLQDFSTYYNNNNRGDIQIASKHVNEVLGELYRMDAGEANVYGDNRTQALEDLKNYYTQLMQSMTDLDDLRKEMHESLLNEIDRVQEKFDEQIKKYETITNLINHDMKMIQLYYGEDSYAKLEKFYRQQQENNEQQLNMLRLEEEFWRKRMDSYEAGTEEYDKAVNNWIEATDKLRSKFIESLQDAAAALKNSVQAAFKELNNKITGGKGLEYIKTEWDLVNKNADRYLDTINRTYAIRQLEKKYTDAINKSSSVANQQKLKKIMDQQILALKQQDELSQYQVDRANKLYEIELARMALEDARNNKSQMRLRRDTQGNYRYQYTANEEEINGAREQLEDLYNSLYNFDKERYNEVLNQAYADWEEYQQKMADAALINDPELRAEREKLIQEQYNELMERNEYDFQVARYNLHESALTDIDRLLNGSDEISGVNIFKKYTDAEEEIILTSLIPTWETGIAEMVQYFASGSDGKGGMTSVKEQLGLVKTTVDTTGQQMNTSWSTNIDGMEVPFTEAVDRMVQSFSGENKDNTGGFAGAVYDGWVKMKDAEEQYDKDIVALEKSSGITLETVKKGTDEAIVKTEKLVEDNQKLIDEYGKELTAVDNCYKKVLNLIEAHKKEAEAAKKAAEEAYNYYSKELEMQQKAYEASEKLRTSQNAAAEASAKAAATTTAKATASSSSSSSSSSGKSSSGGSSSSGSGGKTSGGGTKAKTTYTITLDYNYDGKKETKKVTEGSSVTLPYASRSGYQFNGWGVPSLGMTVGRTSSYTYTPKKSETVTANWSKKSVLSSVAEAVTKGASAVLSAVGGSSNSYQSPLRTTTQTLGLKAYATGGYTGDWNNDGRLAILHQKELVLNQTDTKNMLNAVSIMRNLSGTLGTEMLARLSNASAPGYTNNGSGAALLEQDVHIDATFPNVRNAAEIEEALNNLVNAASQRIWTNR